MPADGHGLLANRIGAALAGHEFSGHEFSGHEFSGHEFSGVVHVSVAGEPLFAMASGLANREAGIPNTVDTRFGLASACKLVTALGVGTLIDDGLLTLATRLVDVVPAELPGMDPAVTIGQLLSHTSGVFDYLDEEQVTDIEHFQLPIPPQKLLRPRDYLPMLTGPQKSPPGTRFSYSNGGYVLLGLVIEELAGSFHGHLERRVLQPAGMRRSGYFRLDRLPPDTAIGYLDGGGTNAGTLPVIGGPDGGLFASALDLQRLWRSFLGGEIISAELVATFTTKVAQYRDGIGYGHGLWIRDGGGLGPILFVEGCDAGVSARSTVYSTADSPTAIVTVLANSTDGAWPIDKIVNGVVQRWYRAG